MMNQKTYAAPSIEVVIFSTCNVITTSGVIGNDVPTIENGGAGGGVGNSSWGTGEGW